MRIQHFGDSDFAVVGILISEIVKLVGYIFLIDKIEKRLGFL